MLLTNGVCASTVQLFNSFPVRHLQRSEHCNVTRLKFMRCVRRETAENDVVFMTELQNFQDSCAVHPSLIRIRGFPLALNLVWGSKTRWNHSKVMSRLLYPLGEQAKCHPVVGWVVQSLRMVDVGQMMRGSRHLPSAEMHSIAVTCVAIGPGSSVSPQVILLKQNLARCRVTERNARFIHVVDILSEKVGVVQLSPDDCEPVCHLFADIVSLPFQWFERSRFETLAFAEACEHVICYPSMEGTGRTRLTYYKSMGRSANRL